MSQGQRPLSPHLEVYRPLTGSFTSILHRATNTALLGGMAVLVLWLASVSMGGQAYEWMNGILSSYFGRIALVGWTFCAIYSAAQWIRHFFWDLGYGFELEASRLSGRVAVVFAGVATLAIWVLVIMRNQS
ncbi:MAG: succinate dehydrogenase, cytochrome b556 subunit [Gammaproteobacteria bacterium]